MASPFMSENNNNNKLIPNVFCSSYDRHFNPFNSTTRKKILQTEDSYETACMSRFISIYTVCLLLFLSLFCHLFLIFVCMTSLIEIMDTFNFIDGCPLQKVGVKRLRIVGDIDNRIESFLFVLFFLCRKLFE